MTGRGAAAKAAGGLGKLRARARAGVEGALALSGDPRAVAKLVGRALRRVWRSPLTRRLAVAAAAAALLVVLAVAGGAGSGTVVSVEGASGARFGAEPMVWAAYTVAGRVWCAPDGTVRLSADPLPEPWQRTDWRLVAAVGGVESGHAAGRTVGAFGDVWPPVVGPTLDGTIEGLVTIPDTDGGRFDLDTRWDSAVGPMQLLPSTVASAGIDGNGDGIVDPHNLWDATATASAYLCVAGLGQSPSRAVFAYNHSEVYVDIVLAGLAEIVSAGIEEAHAGWLPDGAPLPYRPSAAPGDPVLGSIVEHYGGDPAAVHCSTGCSWRVARAPETIPQWEALGHVGYAAPKRVPGGVAATGDGTLRAAVPTRGGTAWPLATSAAPQPAGAVPPAWWSHFVPVGHPGWTAAGSRSVAVPAVWASPVYAPQTGTVTGAGDCALLAAGGWLWRLCGVSPDDPLPSPEAGHRIGAATGGTLTVQLVDPAGREACPQTIFARWANAQPTTPQAIAAEIAALTETAKTAADPAHAASAAEAAAALEWALYEECVA